MPQPASSPRSIVIFRIGSLGDTLIAVPSIRAVRQAYPKAHVALLCDHQVGRTYVLGADVLRQSNLVDEFLSYPFARGRIERLARPFRMALLAWQLRRLGYDAVVYLPPSDRGRRQIRRDRFFFRLAGIQRFIGFDSFPELPSKRPGRPLPTMPREAELLLGRVAASGVPIARPVPADLNLNQVDHQEVDLWLQSLPTDGGRRWIAVGPGSKMPAKIWPAERFQTVVQRLVEQFDVWPVIFGGSEDRPLGDKLLQSWNRGYNAAGTLGVRPSAAAMSRCALYLGNDTGTMHLAAAEGVRCVAIFCSHSRPGWWHPIGQGHRIFRTPIDCENCALHTCIERKMECILKIGVDEVHAACAEILSSPMSRSNPVVSPHRD